MRAYWYGDGKSTRIALNQNMLPRTNTTVDVPQLLSSRFEYPRLLDWSTRVDEWDEVLVYTTQSAEVTPTVPGREDLDAEFLVIWIRQAQILALFFAKMLPDLVQVLEIVASYEKALCDITEHHERLMGLRARHAEDVADVGR